jgi:hypothetical protein
MSTEDLYGVNTNDLEAARILVAKTPGIESEPRNSPYHGGDYYSKKLESNDEIVLHVNNDGEEGGWADEDYKDFGVLLRLYSPEHGDEYKNVLTSGDTGFVLLERSLTTPSGVLRDVRYTDGKEEIYFEKLLDTALIGSE